MKLADLQALQAGDPKGFQEAIRGLSEEDFLGLKLEALRYGEEDRKRNQLIYYQPVSAEALEFHKSGETIRMIAGGNRSSKTDSAFADLIIRATGVVPDSLAGIYPMERIRTNGNYRICVTTFQTAF